LERKMGVVPRACRLAASSFRIVHCDGMVLLVALVAFFKTFEKR
jgi:hypothetical protein